MPSPRYSYAPIILASGKPDTPPPAPCTRRICTPEEIEAMLSKYDLEGPYKKPLVPGSDPKRKEVEQNANHV